MPNWDLNSDRRWLSTGIDIVCRKYSLGIVAGTLLWWVYLPHLLGTGGSMPTSESISVMVIKSLSMVCINIVMYVLHCCRNIIYLTHSYHNILHLSLKACRPCLGYLRQESVITSALTMLVVVITSWGPCICEWILAPISITIITDVFQAVRN